MMYQVTKVQRSLPRWMTLKDTKSGSMQALYHSVKVLWEIGVSRVLIHSIRPKPPGDREVLGTQFSHRVMLVLIWGPAASYSMHFQAKSVRGHQKNKSKQRHRSDSSSLWAWMNLLRGILTWLPLTRKHSLKQERPNRLCLMLSTAQGRKRETVTPTNRGSERRKRKER